jgi:hypothetical protein
MYFVGLLTNIFIGFYVCFYVLLALDPSIAGIGLQLKLTLLVGLVGFVAAQFIAGHRRVMSTENLIEMWTFLAGHTKQFSFCCKNFFVAASLAASFSVAPRGDEKLFTTKFSFHVQSKNYTFQSSFQLT